eukprot:CAMPEP_0183372364 /NCGR_PEP_ID=MMETSP0164_2-20130417/108258_1 /TAXON_ID=221442 /ORGANISM="Coccolithus pelagicus ssp braarudi, Strain PLY182g" /LENGTH=195 /DNA_ID=CAMNT_0025549051 /DNA_START=52 /DNA_END=639 /DNA_ORIENTATION=+
MRRVTETGERPEKIDLPVEVMPHLLLGDKRSASELHMLEALGITHVVNVAGTFGKTAAHGQCSAYLQLHAQDEEGYPILARHLAETSAFIHRAREEGGRCLIHCQAGLNRSACLAVAELMISERLPLLDAVRRVKAARGDLLTNESFRAQLIDVARAHGLLGEPPSGMVAAADREWATYRAKQPRRSAAEALRGL